MQTLKNPGTKQQVLGKWLGRLVDSHEFCRYCGQRKKDYINPATKRLHPLDCMCERVLKNLEETKTGIVNTQYQIEQRIAQDKTKMSSEEKKYMIESEQVLGEINLSISEMRQRGARLNANHREGAE